MIFYDASNDSYKVLIHCSVIYMYHYSVIYLHHRI